VSNGLSTPTEAAANLADEITQWVGSARTLRPPEELAAEYSAAGLDYAPPETPLESLEELMRVHGMTAQAFASMRPHLTLFGGRQPDAATTDPIVAAATRFADQTNSAVSGGGPILSGIGADARVIRILTSARGPGHAMANSTVIVRINGSDVHGYSILSWRNGLQ
jgi:general secretion pathway protein K